MKRSYQSQINLLMNTSFLGETQGVSRYWDKASAMFGRLFFRREFSSSNISKTVWPRIAKVYGDIHTDIVYSHTGYCFIIYFRSEVIEENSRKYHLRRLRVEFLENGSC